MFDLSGHVALVTGSTQGVGLAIADALARAGSDLVLHGRTAAEAPEDLIERFTPLGVRASLVAGDLAGPTEASVDRLFEAALATDDRIDLLVSNAGTFIDRPYLEMDATTFETTMRLNVAAPYFLTQRFARRWIERGISGRVLITGSINGRLAEPGHTAYDTSKGAVEMMVKTLCVALAPHNIRVNGLAPGLVRTPLTRALDEQPALDAWMRLHTPNGQVPGAEVCGPGAVYLLSDEASHVHGQMHVVDGGMSAWQQPDVGGSDER